MSDDSSLLGVMTAPWRDDEAALEAQHLEARRDPPTPGDYQLAASVVREALDATRQRLRALRDEKEATRMEIKRLVAEEYKLERMLRITASDDDS